MLQLIDQQVAGMEALSSQFEANVASAGARDVLLASAASAAQMLTMAGVRVKGSINRTIESANAAGQSPIAPPPNTGTYFPRGPAAASGPLPPNYVTVSRWVSPEEASLWMQNGGTAIPAAIPRNGTSQVYVTQAGAPYPAEANGTVRMDFAVPSSMLRPGNASDNAVILQPSASTPVYNVNIHVPNGTTLPNKEAR